MSPDGGIPGWFIGIVVLMMVAGAVTGIGSWLYRMSVARRIAESAGLDPDQAAQVTMLSKDGVDATYLAAALSQRSQRLQPPTTHPTAPQPTTPATRPKTAEERLRELQALRDGGLVSEDEFQAQRLKILGSI